MLSAVLPPRCASTPAFLKSSLSHGHSILATVLRSILLISPTSLAAETQPTAGAPAPVLFVNNDDLGVVAMAADVVVYSLTCGNSGNQDARGVVLTQTVPDHTEFDPASSDPGWSCSAGGGSGDRCIFTIGDLPVAGFGATTFGVRVAVDVPRPVTALSNVLEIADDGSQTGGVPVTAQDIEETPIALFDRVSVRIYAFEDLRNQPTFVNDFDYNDWIISVELREKNDDAGNWSRIDLVIEALARGSIFNHQPGIDLGIAGMVDVTISRFGGDGAFLSRELSSVNGEMIPDLVLFNDTFTALPPASFGANPLASNTDINQTEGDRTEGPRVHIRVDVQEPAMNPRLLDDPGTAHLDETFNHLVGPFIHVIDTDERIFQRWRLRSVAQSLVTAALFGEDTPLLAQPLDLVEPFSEVWQWPIERKPIWQSYPLYADYISSGKLLFLDWFQIPFPGQVWPVVNADIEPEPPARETSSASPESLRLGHTFASPVSASPAVGDLDNNGTLEIVVGGFLDEIVIFDSTGAVLRTLDPNVAGTQESNASITLADLDGDLDLEIIRGYDDGAVYAFHHDGTPAGIWSTGRAPLRATVTVADVLGGPDPELFLLAGNTLFYGWDVAGDALPGFPVAVGGVVDHGNAFVLLPVPVVADVDGSGGPEIIVVSNTGDVHVLNATGDALAGWPVALGETVLASPAVADLDPRAGLEIVIAADSGRVSILGADGTILRTMQRALGGPSSPAIGNLDSDQGLEIVVGSLDGKVYAWHHDGTAVLGWPFVTGSAIQGSPTVTDFDGDGKGEVVFGSFDMRLYALDGRASPLRSVTGDAFPITLHTPLFSSPAVADLDGDGLPSIIIGGYDRFVYAVETEGNIPPYSILWSEFRNGGGHTGAATLPVQPDNGVSPTIVSVQVGSDRVGACGEARSVVEQIDFGFSELMADPAGDTAAGDVTSPQSYRLLRAGIDRDLQSDRCGAPAGDDVLVAIDAVSWDPFTMTASLLVGGGEPLADDLYRLVVCDTLEDTVGDGFDGDGDGLAGGDWLGQVRIALGNGLANGQLDCDVAGWFSDAGAGAVSHAVLDVFGAAASGSLRVVDLAMPSDTLASQCIPLAAGQPIFSGMLRVEGSGPANVVRRCSEFATPDCQGSAAVVVTEVRETIAPTMDAWIPFRDRTSDLLQGVSYRCEVGVEVGTGPLVEVFFDDLRITDAVIFSDNLETGDMANWSKTIGDLP